MPYSAREDIENQVIPTSDLVSLTDDELAGEQNPEINKRIAAAIESADTEIDAMLRGLYTVPLSPVPDIVKRISAKLAAWNLWSRRSGEKPENIRDEYKWCQTILKYIQERKIQLGDEEPVKGGEMLVSKTDEDRLFGQSTLDKMP